MPFSSQFQSLQELGWSVFFEGQLSFDEIKQHNLGTILPVRITRVHRIRLQARSEDGEHVFSMAKDQGAGEFAVGDWLLIEPSTEKIVRKLDRQTVLQRLNFSSQNQVQLIASNIDTLFIVTSCNADFDLAWIDRLLALAFGAGVTPVVVLTKTDQTKSPDTWARQVRTLSPNLAVEAINTHDPAHVRRLEKWCQPGQSTAMIGSSGVGKSTILNAMCQIDTQTGEINEKNAQGHHTTTARILHQTKSGGWLIDTPGIRVLHLHEAEKGINLLFKDITELTEKCQFRDCTHTDEPGCALNTALLENALDRNRYQRWNKLRQSSNPNSGESVEPVISWREQQRITKAIKHDQKHLKRKQKK